MRGAQRVKGPSPAMVVAVIAVVFAVAGTGVASVATISALSKKEKKQTKSIADSEINKLAPGLSVSKAANADKVGGVGADGFLPSSGSVQIQVGPANWVAGNDGGSTGIVVRDGNEARLGHTGAGTNQFFFAAVTIPSALQGRPLRVDSFELCYKVDANANLNSVFLGRYTDTAADPVSTSGSLLFADNTVRTDATCRTYAAGGPATVGPNDTFQLALRADYTASSAVEVSRLTINMSD
jgi:hypothetical protein